jgi:2-polyprenyl-6-hydroxyphenyl methylase/3-demethylubiquinone-9 3-methyltransferase
MQFFNTGPDKQFLETPLFNKRSARMVKLCCATYQRRLKRTIELVRKYVRCPARVLDLGAAEGNFSLLLAQNGYQVTWNDYIASREGYVRLKITDENIDFLPGNVFELQPDNKFDCILATEIIEHVAHPDQFLSKAAGFCSKGGILILSTPNGNYLRNKLPRFSDFNSAQLTELEQQEFKPDGDGHIFALYRDEIQKICEANSLKIEYMGYDSPPFKLASIPFYNTISYAPYLNVLLCQGVVFVCRVM